MAIELNKNDYNRMMRLSYEELVKEQHDVEYEMSNIKSQMNEAKTLSYAGEPINIQWMKRARIAHMYKMLYIRYINKRLIELKAQQKLANIERDKKDRQAFNGAF